MVRSFASFLPAFANLVIGAGPSRGVRLSAGETSDDLPLFLNGDWQVPKVPGPVNVKQPGGVHSWLRDAAVITLPARWLVPEPIPTPPSPARSEWSDLSLATRKPDTAQGFFNRETTIEEEYECEESVMDVE